MDTKTKEYILGNIDKFSDEDLAKYVFNKELEIEKLNGIESVESRRSAIDSIINSKTHVKEGILGNINMISEELLAEYISIGFDGGFKITLSEMRETGDLDASKRREIQSIVEGLDKIKKEKEEKEKEEKEEKEKNVWKEVVEKREKATVESFILDFSNGIYYNEAIRLLDEIIDIEKNKGKILNEIQENSSNYRKYDLKKYLETKAITKEDLLKLGIPQKVIDNLHKDEEELDISNSTENIPAGYTEVYFWGLPGSGKTCAISSFCKIASQGGLLGIDADIKNENANSASAYDYYRQVTGLYDEDYFGILPNATNKGHSQHIPLKLYNNNNSYKVALIDLSGEVFEAFDLKMRNEDFSGDIPLTNTFNRVINYLNGPNKQIHFFIVDFTVSPDKKIKKGRRQLDYLVSAIEYLNQYDVLKKSGEGVFIVASKSDMLSKNRDQAKSVAVDKLKRNYTEFYESLRRAKEKSRMGSDLNVIPFTLGDVYFNDYCFLNEDSPLEIMDWIIKHTGAEDDSSIAKVIKKVKSFFNL